MQKKHKKTLKSGERRLGALGAKTKYSDEFPRFSFCITYLRLGYEEVDNPEMSIGADKTPPTKT